LRPLRAISTDLIHYQKMLMKKLPV